MKVFLEALKTKLLELVYGRSNYADQTLDPKLLEKFVDAQNKFGSQVKKKGAAK